MATSKSLSAFLSILILGGAVFVSAPPARAYVACNRGGDCWHTGSKALDWSGVMLTYHDDDWWDAHKGDGQYRFHDADAHHDWQTGYWKNNKWYGGY